MECSTASATFTLELCIAFLFTFFAILRSLLPLYLYTSLEIIGNCVMEVLKIECIEMSRIFTLMFMQ